MGTEKEATPTERLPPAVPSAACPPALHARVPGKALGLEQREHISHVFVVVVEDFGLEDVDCGLAEVDRLEHFELRALAQAGGEGRGGEASSTA